MTTKREFLIALGAGALAAPLAAFSQQQGKVWRIGFLVARSRPASLDTGYLGAFRQGMRNLGYVEGKNLLIEWRFADRPERVPALATELVHAKVEVILVHSTPNTQTLQEATSTIPIVMINIADPIGAGLIKSFAHPGGNITGLSNHGIDTIGKRLEMLVSLIPKLSRVAALLDPSNPGSVQGHEVLEAMGSKLGLNILRAEARTPEEIVSAFSLMTKHKSQAVMLNSGSAINAQLPLIANLAAKHGLPSVHQNREYVEAGGLIAYGANLADLYRRAASFVDKILKGIKPADLPVEQPMKFELVINAKTAKALGLKIPQSLLVMADKVIE